MYRFFIVLIVMLISPNVFATDDIEDLVQKASSFDLSESNISLRTPINREELRLMAIACSKFNTYCFIGKDTMNKLVRNLVEEVFRDEDATKKQRKIADQLETEMLARYKEMRMFELRLSQISLTDYLK